MKYTVKAGDTLSKISYEFYGTYNRYMEIAEASQLEDPDRIHVGMELTIPGVVEEKASEPEVQTSANSEMVAEKKPTTAPNLTQSAMLTIEQLQAIMPKASQENIDRYLTALNANIEKFAINTPLRLAHFIAQLAHESASFRYSSENLNYSAKALRGVFGKYFPDDEIADAYARQPEKIANRVYANRMDNGDEASGDGWKFRGRGLIQLTGKQNYTQCGKALDLDLLNKPDQLAEDANTAVAAAGWFWDTHQLNRYTDEDNVKEVTRKINGGYNGLEDRIEFLEKAKSVLMS